jgi:lipocalin
MYCIGCFYRGSRRITAGYTWTDHKTNTKTAKELNVTPIFDKIQDYKRNWIHVNRMPHNITQDNKKLHPKRTKERGKTTEETFRCMRPE